MTVALPIPNRDARWLWLESQGLSKTPTGPLDLLPMIKRLGFVQLDTIRNVTRAHHHILWSRNQNYREPLLNRLMSGQRALFEHFTHDASVIPMDYYPMWQRQFRRLGERSRRSRKIPPDELAAIKARIAAEGPLSTHAFDTKITGKKEMWARPPHKHALDQMWYAGELTTAHRVNFIKYYDLAERVIPADLHRLDHDDAAQQDWLCRAALDRLGFGSAGDIQRFWAALDAREVKAWLAQVSDQLVPVAVQSHSGEWLNMLAPADIEDRLARLRRPTSRLRIINPFDPAVRDRTRLARLFGFAYRNEMFVPAAERQFGYYVYPLLEGDRFVGRMEVQADRKKGCLTVTQLWLEPRIAWTGQRAEKLDAELVRLGRLVGADSIQWTCERPRA